MKTGWLVLGGAVLIILASFSIRFAGSKMDDNTACVSCHDDSRDTRTALAWMKKEFQLNDMEFQKVCTLHEAYLPKCDVMCKRMSETSSKLIELLQTSGSITPEIEAALSANESSRSECQRETLRHLMDTAAVMRPEVGRSFLKKVLPHLLATQQHLTEVQR